MTFSAKHFIFQFAIHYYKYKKAILLYREQISKGINTAILHIPQSLPDNKNKIFFWQTIYLQNCVVFYKFFNVG